MNNPQTLSLQIARQAILFLCLGQVGLAFASDYSEYIHIGLDSQSFHFKEYDEQGNLLLREDGLLPGIEFGYDVSSGPDTIAMRIAVWDGNVDYEGQTQTGNPLSTTTDTTITNYSVAFMRDIRNHPVSLIVSLGMRRWDRHIRRTALTNSLYEIYYWPYYMLSGESTLFEQDKFDVKASLSVGRSFSSTMDLHISGYDTTTLNLPSGNTFRLGIPISYQWKPDRTLNIEPYFHYWHFDRSRREPLYRNGVIVGQVHEPENETTSFGVSLSMQF